jgi:hypothetical protein
LRDIVGGEHLLQRMAAIGGQPFYRRDEAAFRFPDRHLARSHRLPVNIDGAGAAMARAAAIFGPGEVRSIAQRP